MDMSRRLVTSVSQAARFSVNHGSILGGSQLPSRATASFIFSRRRQLTTSSADEQTLAKSAELLDALVGSSTGLNLSPSFSKDMASQSSTPTARPTKQPTDADTLANMFIPPADDPLLNHLTSALQHRGHRAKAARLVSRMLLHLHAYTRAPPVPILREAILMVAPAVKCASHRHATKDVLFPYALTEKQHIHAGVKALLKASESKPGKSVDVRLAREIIAVLQGQSVAIEEKVKLHKVAMINRANSR